MLKLIVVCCILAVAQAKVCSTPLANAVTASGYCAYQWTSGLGNPRGIISASNNDVLLVDSKSAQIYVLWEDTTGVVSKALLATASCLNHALQINGAYLYASSATTVYRWKYSAGQRSSLGAATTVVTNLPCCHHTSRALAFDQSNNLYVQSGSGSNVDSDSSHSQIRKFNIANLPNGGVNWSTGELFASGVRNEAGIRFDATGQLWGVENGCDDLNRSDLGGDIHNNNPSEELNLFKTSGKFYGYPYCWSEYDLPMNQSHPRGSQWVHPNFINDGTHSDNWCRSTTNVVPPAYNFQAHMAPLDILFYYGTSFPGIAKGDAFVAFHGSWDRQPPVGYKVQHVKYTSGMPVADDVFLAYKGPGATGSGWIRPVALAVHKCQGTTECLLVTSDATGGVIAIVPN